MPRTRALAIAGSALLVLLLAVPAVPAVAPHALAAWIRPAGTGVDPNPVAWSVAVDEAGGGLWDPFEVTFTWSDPAASSREEFTLDLPQELAPVPDAFDVRADTGETVARAAVGDHSLTVTYTDEVRGALSGTATFVAGWNDGAASPGEGLTLVFSAAGTTQEVPVRIATERTNPDASRFYGYWRDRTEDANSAERALQWRIVTGRGPLSEAVVDVDLGAGHRLDCDSIAGRLQTAFAANGDVTEARDLPAGTLDVRNCDATGLTVDLSDVDPGTALMVLFSSTVTAPAASSFVASASLNGQELTSTIDRTPRAGSAVAALGEPPVGTAGTVDTVGTADSQSAPAANDRLWLPLALLAALGGSALLYRVMRRRLR